MRIIIIIWVANFSSSLDYILEGDTVYQSSIFCLQIQPDEKLA